MSKIERFEDIQAWQKARELSKEIYRVTNDEPFTKDYSWKDKIRRASTSIMLNIAEGFARRSTNEFKQFLYIAHGSAQKFNQPFILLWIRTHMCSVKGLRDIFCNFKTCPKKLNTTDLFKNPTPM